MIDRATLFKEERIFSAAHRNDTCLWGPDIADRLVHSHERMEPWRPNLASSPASAGMMSSATSLSLLGSMAASIARHIAQRAKMLWELPRRDMSEGRARHREFLREYQIETAAFAEALQGLAGVLRAGMRRPRANNCSELGPRLAAIGAW